MLMKCLAIVAATANAGPPATELQESVFRRAAAAELSKSASRTQPDNLTSRIFINVNENNLRDPVKGSKTPLHTLKRKDLLPGGGQDSGQKLKKRCLIS